MIHIEHFILLTKEKCVAMSKDNNEEWNAGTMGKTIQEAARMGKSTQSKQVHLLHAKVIGKEGISRTAFKNGRCMLHLACNPSGGLYNPSWLFIKVK